MSGWKAEAGPIDVEFTNGAKVAAGLKVAPREMKRELRRSNALVGREARGWLRSAASSGTSQQRHMARGIGSSASSTEVRVTIQNTRSAPGALGAFYGAKRYPQFPTWVGNSWKPATAGEGPYVINPELARRQPAIETIYLQGQADAVARALPRF